MHGVPCEGATQVVEARTRYYEVGWVDGQVTTFGGTSAVAPLWASLIALINQQSGKDVGYLNPVLYGKMIGATRDITKGNNGEYDAKIGWDACTGLGSPDGIKILLDWK